MGCWVGVVVWAERPLTRVALATHPLPGGEDYLSKIMGVARVWGEGYLFKIMRTTCGRGGGWLVTKSKRAPQGVPLQVALVVGADSCIHRDIEAMMISKCRQLGAQLSRRRAWDWWRSFSPYHQGRDLFPSLHAHTLLLHQGDTMYLSNPTFPNALNSSS